MAQPTIDSFVQTCTPRRLKRPHESTSERSFNSEEAENSGTTLNMLVWQLDLRSDH